jgi:hypothetical protein
MNRKNRFTSLALLSVGLLALNGCGGGNGGSNNNAEGRAFAVHAIANASATPVDILVNNQLPFDNIGYGQLVGNPTIDAGNRSITVQNATNGTALVSSQSIAITEDIDQLLLIGGQIGGTGTLAPRVYNLGRVDVSDSSIPNSAQARVYFVNAVADSPVEGADFSYSQSGPATNPTEGQDIDFAQLSNQVLVTNGAYTFSATLGGETVNASATTLDGRGVYLVLLTGNRAGSGQTPGLTLQVRRLD